MITATKTTNAQCFTLAQNVFVQSKGYYKISYEVKPFCSRATWWGSGINRASTSWRPGSQVVQWRVCTLSQASWLWVSRNREEEEQSLIPWGGNISRLSGLASWDQLFQPIWWLALVTELIQRSLWMLEKHVLAQEQILVIRGAIPPFIHQDLGRTRTFLCVLSVTRFPSVRAQLRMHFMTPSPGLFLHFLIITLLHWYFQRFKAFYLIKTSSKPQFLCCWHQSISGADNHPGIITECIQGLGSPFQTFEGHVLE